MVKTTWKSDLPWSAIFSVIVYWVLDPLLRDSKPTFRLSKPFYLSKTYTFKINVLKISSSSYAQNIIGNIALTSYLDKPYFVAS